MYIHIKIEIRETGRNQKSNVAMLNLLRSKNGKKIEKTSIEALSKYEKEIRATKRKS